MQRSVSANINELHELTETIQAHSKELHEAYEQAQKVDNMKTVFLHNMTDQMLDPTFAIDEDVSALSHFDKETSTQTVSQLVEDIQQNGDTITQILNNLINLSEKEEDLEEKGGKL
jgi:methyl-accepting chemotaxis protein